MIPKAPRLNSLTSLRYLAALAVVVTHVNPYFIRSQFLLAGLAFWNVGVSFFFMLSGFVLAWSCSRQPWVWFWCNRFSRIWPLATTMMVIAYLCLWSQVGHPHGALGWMLQPFLLQAWDPDHNVYAGGNGPTWSLSCEFFFYAMFPIATLGVRRLRARGLLTAGVATITLMIVLPAVICPHVSAHTAIWLFGYLPAYRFGEFLIGMLIARAMSLGMRFPRPAAGYLLGFAWFAVWDVAVAVYTLSHHGNPPDDFYVALLVLPSFALLIVAGASADLSGTSRLLARRLPVRLGEWSFALYMVHDPIAVALTRHLWLRNSGGLLGLTYMLAFIAGCTVIAMLAHIMIERPAERWLRQRLGAAARSAGIGSRPPSRHSRGARDLLPASQSGEAPAEVEVMLR